MMMAFSVADIERAHKENKLAALMGIEGGHSIENDIHLLRDYYRLGVRYMTLSWSNTNEWADSSGDINDPKVQHHNGLTDFGKQVVLEMNRLGMMVDISHVADKTFYDAIATTQGAGDRVAFVGARADQHPRNMTDDMLRAVAKNGGVVQVNFFNAFDRRELSQGRRGAEQRARCGSEAAISTRLKAAGKTVTYHRQDRIEREWAAKIPRPPLKSLIDHIDHIAKVAGVDHVGWARISTASAARLRKASIPPPTCRRSPRPCWIAATARTTSTKSWAATLLRVFREVERVSREMQARAAACRYIRRRRKRDSVLVVQFLVTSESCGHRSRTYKESRMRK